MILHRKRKSRMEGNRGRKQKGERHRRREMEKEIIEINGER